MTRLIFSSLAAVWAAGGMALAQTPPVGLASGDVFFSDADTTPAGRGARLDVAPGPGNLGSYSLGSGGVLTLNAGSGGPGRIGRPEIILGGGDRVSAGGIGNVFVSGLGSAIELIGNNTGPSVFIGEEQGTGRLELSTGAALRLEDLGILDVDSAIGENGAKVQVGRSEGTGVLEMDDASLEITATSRALLTVGTETGGSGTMSVVNGSTVTITEVADPAAVSNNADVRVGDDTGNGTLTIADSTFRLESEGGLANFRVGDLGGTGTVNLSGASARLDVVGQDAEVLVGRRNGSSGTMNVTGGATVEIATTTSDDATLRIASDGTNTGIVNVQSGGSILVGATANQGRIFVGDDDAAAGEAGTGTLNISGAGSRVEATTEVLVGKRSGAGSSTGVLSVSSGATLVSPTISIFEGGVLKGNGGTVLGNVFVESGGSVLPGSSPGRLLIDGDLTLRAGSLIDFEIGGTDAADYDILDITGNLVADGAFDLMLTLVGGFVPADGASFNVLRVGGNVAPDFLDLANLMVVGAPAGSFAFDPTSGSLVFSANGEPSVIPLPAPAILLIAALASLSLVRRRTAA